MDEPTTSLTDVEIEQVFKMMTTLKQSGVSIVFISHKLKEIIRICDTFTVLRDGQCRRQRHDQRNRRRALPAGASPTSIWQSTWWGRDVLSIHYYREREIGDVVLETNNLSFKREFQNVNFKIRKGEIVGFAGLLGDGRSELFECIFGCRKGYQGKILINGKEVRMTGTTKAHASGLGYVPRNRKENAIIKDMSILHNVSIVTIGKFVRHLLIDGKKEYAACMKHAGDLNIKFGNFEDLITSLSGGNQQKVVLAKWLEAKPSVLIFDNPTQGVDVGAKKRNLQHHYGLGGSGYEHCHPLKRSHRNHQALRPCLHHVSRRDSRSSRTLRHDGRKHDDTCNRRANRLPCGGRNPAPVKSVKHFGEHAKKRRINFCIAAV